MLANRVHSGSFNSLDSVDERLFFRRHKASCSLVILVAAPAWILAEEKLPRTDLQRSGRTARGNLFTEGRRGAVKFSATTLRVLRAPVMELSGRELALACQAALRDELRHHGLDPAGTVRVQGSRETRATARASASRQTRFFTSNASE